MKAQLELSVQDLNIQLANDQEMVREASEELDKLISEITVKQEEKNKIDPQFQQKLNQEKDLERR